MPTALHCRCGSLLRTVIKLCQDSQTVARENCLLIKEYPAVNYRKGSGDGNTFRSGISCPKREGTQPARADKRVAKPLNCFYMGIFGTRPGGSAKMPVPRDSARIVGCEKRNPARETYAKAQYGESQRERKVSEVLNSGTSTEVQADLQAGAALSDAAASAGAGASAETKASAVSKVAAVAHSKWYVWRKDGAALVTYLLDSEVHTFAFSVAANAVLSFIPFIVLLYTLARSVFHSPDMANTITDMVIYFFPSDIGDQKFVAGNLAMVAAHGPRHGFQVVLSLVMILIACTGIFLPLEVALNQAWGVTKSRNYLANQVVAFGLAILMVVLGFAAISVTTVSTPMFSDVLKGHEGFLGTVGNISFNVMHFLVLAISTGIASILFFFAIYWLLPNRKVSWRPVLRTAVITGVIWLVSKYLFVEMILPHLHLEDLYGRFYLSVGLIFWAYVSGLIMFAGAQFSVARLGADGKKS